MAMSLVQPHVCTGMDRGHVREALGEDVAAAIRVDAEEAAYFDMEANR